MINLHTKMILNSGNEMPLIGLGTWKLTEHTSEIIITALKMGYRMIDTSGDYGTQPTIGNAIKKSSLAREEIFIISNVEETDNSYEKTKQNLRELNIEYADLMLIHRPPKEGSGEDLWQGLIRAQKEGLIKDIGVSNYSIQKTKDLIKASKVVPAVNQIEWSPFGWSREMYEFTKQNKIIIQAYSPLLRSEKLSDKRLVGIAQKYHKTPAQILIRWNLQLGTVPIPKSNSEEHLKENIAVFDFEIDEKDMKDLENLNENYSALADKPLYMK